MSAVDALTVQIGFGTGALGSPTWHTVPASYVRSIDLQTSTRERFSDAFTPGTGFITLDMSDRVYDPTYASSTHAGDFVWGTQVRVFASGPVYVWRGYIERFQPNVTTHDATVTLECVDFLGLFAEYDADARPAEGLATRVAGLLSDAGWSGTTIDSDASSLAGEDAGEQVLTRLQAAARSNGGYVYYDPSDDDVHFESRAGIATRSRMGTSQRTFGTGGTAVVDGSLRVSAVGDAYRNKATVLGEGEINESAGTPPAGQAERAVTRSTTLTQAPQAATLANYLVDLYDTDDAAPSSWQVDVAIGSTDLAVSAVGATRLRDRVTVAYDPPGTGTESLEVIITGVRHTVSPARWRVTFLAEPAASYDGLDGPPSDWMVWDVDNWDGSSKWGY